ncbi:MAG: pseudouridine synthase, partial [bacterium]
MIRLNKYLAHSGLGSRRSVEKHIKSGEVLINGTPITSPGFLVTPESDKVLFRGNPVESDEYAIYIALNKPQGFITTAKDERGRMTIFNLVSTPLKVFPVGRLDRDSDGLLLLTNDGELANRLIHPRYKVKKHYLVYLNRNADKEVIRKFREGIVIDKKYNVTAGVQFPNTKNM